MWLTFLRIPGCIFRGWRVTLSVGAETARRPGIINILDWRLSADREVTARAKFGKVFSPEHSFSLCTEENQAAEALRADFFLFTNTGLMAIMALCPQTRALGFLGTSVLDCSFFGGALVSTGMLEALVAGRGAAGLVKSGNKVIANNDYEYAYAA